MKPIGCYWAVFPTRGSLFIGSSQSSDILRNNSGEMFIYSSVFSRMTLKLSISFLIKESKLVIDNKNRGCDVYSNGKILIFDNKKTIL